VFRELANRKASARIPIIEVPNTEVPNIGIPNIEIPNIEIPNVEQAEGATPCGCSGRGF
jgi:hypothetical protein